ncbi:MAG: hypothetical protein M3506_02015 [Chloroflexota bacterium]|nr:hypothetical protein [Chloroflexota bacterium]
MKRFPVAALICLLAVLFTSVPADAGVVWCKRDPIVLLDGTTVQILVGIPKQYVPLVNGPVDVRIWHPRSVDHTLLFTDTGFNRHGETVRFGALTGRPWYTGAFETRIQVVVPMDSAQIDPQSVPVQVTVIPSNSATEVAYGAAAWTQMTLAITPTP